MCRLLIVMLLALPGLIGADEPNPPGIEGFRRLSDLISSGGQPQGDAAFAALNRQGIKTIISVDGSLPDLDRAKRYGMRYVHLPVGYDGISRVQQLKLIKAVTDLPGPVFVHCHHGKHRGPTAVAICEMATEGWDQAKARAWMSQAGTDPKYKGLYETVATFVKPTEQDLAKVALADLPERAKVPDLVEAMVEIDDRWDRLKAFEKLGFRPIVSESKITPAHDALMIVEQFREASRGPTARKRGDEFLRAMTKAEQLAVELERSLRAPETDKSKQNVISLIHDMNKSCVLCHSKFRDHSKKSRD